MKIRTVTAMTNVGWLLILAVIAILFVRGSNRGPSGGWGFIYLAMAFMPPFIGLYLAALGLNFFCVFQAETSSKVVGGIGLLLALVALLWVASML